MLKIPTKKYLLRNNPVNFRRVLSEVEIFIVASIKKKNEFRKIIHVELVRRGVKLKQIIHSRISFISLGYLIRVTIISLLELLFQLHGVKVKRSIPSVKLKREKFKCSRGSDKMNKKFYQPNY